MSSVVICDICGRRVAPHGHYILKMEVYADPSLPPISADELEEKDWAVGIIELIEQMKQMTADELQDQVHRRFEFRLCATCQARFIANPLGLSRDTKLGAN